MVIAQIDPEIFKAKVNQAQTDVDSAKGTVLTQQAQADRARADVENARAALAEGKAQTARARVMVADAKRDVDRQTPLSRRELTAKSEHNSAQAAYNTVFTLLDAALAEEQALAVAEAMLESAHAQLKQKEAAQHQAVVDLKLGGTRPRRVWRYRRRVRVNESGRCNRAGARGFIAGDGHNRSSLPPASFSACWPATRARCRPTIAVASEAVTAAVPAHDGWPSRYTDFGP